MSVVLYTKKVVGSIRVSGEDLKRLTKKKKKKRGTTSYLKLLFAVLSHSH